MTTRWLPSALESPLATRLAAPDRAALREALPRVGPGPAAGDDRLVVDGVPFGRWLPFGSVALYRPDLRAPLRHRLLEVDRGGTVVTAIERGPAGDLRAAWVDAADGAPVGLLPGGARHPLWGRSDRLVRLAAREAAAPLTLAGAVDWAAVDHIPPVAEPGRLPPGSGSALLNVLAALALDQGRLSLRYRGPYPTEQLFWSLVESFRCDPGPDPPGRFLAEAEATFRRAVPREVPVDWTPAPHERQRHRGGLTVCLRDGVEKVTWQGRTYVRPEWRGQRRREHRTVRQVAAAGSPGYVASLEALGIAIEDHVLLDARGEPLERRSPAPDEARDCPLATGWSDALHRLLPLEATPLLAGAIDAVWPALRLVWGGVPGDLVEVRGETIRLSPKLARAYRRLHKATPRPAARALAQRLVREVLGLVGPGVRALAATWLDALPAARQDAELERGATLGRADLARAALLPLGRLLDALEAGGDLPA